jgi:hypothetical protein
MSVQHSNIPACVPCGSASAERERVGRERERVRVAFEAVARELAGDKRPTRQLYSEVVSVSAALDRAVAGGVWDLRQVRLYDVRRLFDRARALASTLPGVESMLLPRVKGISVARAGWRKVGRQSVTSTSGASKGDETLTRRVARQAGVCNA